MAGEGYMLHAINTLRQNRAMLKKRRSAKENDLHVYSSTQTKVHFKEVSPEELQRIKGEIREKANKVKRRDFIITLVIFFIGLGVFVYLNFYASI
ncbi:hypothetical protein [uncultured Maribacter sp.]|uniref:hypothetical protein n=1 Tax=uncultured Maribacter sp. TaxID=431308 RepID=UPI0026369D5E|nr:hypothetical protein [uncultured Maribacter sp.]